MWEQRGTISSRLAMVRPLLTNSGHIRLQFTKLKPLLTNNGHGFLYDFQSWNLFWLTRATVPSTTHKAEASLSNKGHGFLYDLQSSSLCAFLTNILRRKAYFWGKAAITRQPHVEVLQTSPIKAFFTITRWIKTKKVGTSKNFVAANLASFFDASKLIR